MPKKARLNPQRTEGERKGCWEPKFKAGQIIFITVLQSLLALGTALPGKAVDQTFSEALRQKEETRTTAEGSFQTSEINEKELDDKIPEKLISLAAFQPHKLTTIFLEKAANLGKNTGTDTKRFLSETNQIAALMLFATGEHEKFQDLISSIQMHKEVKNSKEKINQKLLEAAENFISGKYTKSEEVAQHATKLFFEEHYENDAERLVHGRVLIEILAVYLKSDTINSLRQKILLDAMKTTSHSCEERNHLKTQLRDTYIEQVSDMETWAEKNKLLENLPIINKSCLYSKDIVSIQGTMVNIFREMLSQIKKLDLEETLIHQDLEATLTNKDLELTLANEDAYKILKASLILDPKGMTMRSLVERNGFSGTGRGWTNEFLAKLILEDSKAEEIFRKSKSDFIHTAINKSAIGLQALETARDNQQIYSKKEQDKALELARFGLNNLLEASKAHQKHSDIAWQISSAVIILLLDLSSNDLEGMADYLVAYLEKIKSSKLKMSTMQEDIYLAYIVSGNLEKAVSYGERIQSIDLRGWKEEGLHIPSGGESYDADFMEYIARQGVHLFLVEKIAQEREGARKTNLYKRGAKLVLKDLINKKGISLDILKKRNEALNSDAFTNEEIKLINEEYRQRSAYPFRQAKLNKEMSKRNLEARLRKEIDERIRGRTSQEIVTIKQASVVLESGELLVEYVRKNGSYYVIILNHEGEISIAVAGGGNEVDDLVNNYLSNLSDVKDVHTSDTSKKLKDFLFSPIQDELSESHTIYISPDAAFHKIPLHLVISDQDNNSSFPTTRLVTSGRDLINIEKKINKELTTKSVVIANPDFNFNPADKKVSDEKSGQSKWIELSGTEKEGEEITKLLDATYISQKKATKQFLQAIQSPEILHIATHAFYNQEGKDLKINSGMVFAGANNLPPEESIMSPEEISVLDLEQTRLSVLSACETGIGAVLDGGSIASIQRAFTIAGSQSVINTLWKVDDYSTRAFMKSFYTNLKSGMSLEDSLSTTREYFQRHPIARWRDPYFWAAFQLYGYWGPIF